MVNECRRGVNIATTINGVRIVYPVNTVKSDDMRSFDDFANCFSHIFYDKIGKPSKFFGAEVSSDKNPRIGEIYRRCWTSKEDILFDVSLRAILSFLICTRIGSDELPRLKKLTDVDKLINGVAKDLSEDDTDDITDEELMCYFNDDDNDDDDDEEIPIWDDEDDAPEKKHSKNEKSSAHSLNTIEVIINTGNDSHTVLVASSFDANLVRFLTLCIIDGFTSNLANPSVVFAGIAKSGTFNEISDSDYEMLLTFVKRVSYLWHGNKYASIFDLIVEMCELIVLFSDEADGHAIASDFINTFAEIERIYKNGLILKQHADEEVKKKNGF
jgi:hypothetical protein